MCESNEDARFFDNLDIQLKNQMKELLVYCGYDSLDLIESLSSESLDEIEKYIRQKAHDSAFDDDSMRKKFFGSNVSVTEVKKFSFNPGSRIILLNRLPDAVKKYKRYV